MDETPQSNPAPRPDRPLLVYDAKCGFCRRWVARWQDRTGDRIEYAPNAAAAQLYPQLTPALLARTVVLLTPDGEVLTGAEAVLTALSHAPSRGWGCWGAWRLWAYHRIPGLAAITELLYGFVARHRQGASVLSNAFSGRDPSPSTYTLAGWVFLRLLGLCFLIAFVSLWRQIHGLVGDDGILPAADYLSWARNALGSACYWKLPTVCWLSTDGAFLNVLCGTGVVMSVLLIIGVAPIPVLALLWLLYLSLSVVGQAFLSFQWDLLLLETGLVAMFLAPTDWRPRLAMLARPSGLGVWLGRVLLFKLMFLSGVTKLLSGDPTWRDLTALDVHYQTQPLPSWIGWHAHHLPESFGRFSVGTMYVIEIGLPFLIFAPRRLRHAAAIGLILLQVLIAATGNYCFFNLLAVTLCLLLLDDQVLRRLIPRPGRERLRIEPRCVYEGFGPRTGRSLANAAGVVILLISLSSLVREMVRTQRRSALPASVVAVLDAADGLVLHNGGNFLLSLTDPMRTINGYGLFRVMTTKRPEIIIEASNDGLTWTEYELPWKPGDPQRRPRFVAPHQPRLDWQMWFAALNPDGNAYWLSNLAQRLLEGSPAVVDLFAWSPDAPPRYIRFMYYRYEFTDPATRRATGRWWQRERLGPLTAPISLSPKE